MTAWGLAAAGISKSEICNDHSRRGGPVRAPYSARRPLPDPPYNGFDVLSRPEAFEPPGRPSLPKSRGFVTAAISILSSAAATNNDIERGFFRPPGSGKFRERQDIF